MAEIIEKRIVNSYIECTMALGSASLYVPRGIFDRTWFIKKSDGTVMECRVKEFGHCLVQDGEKKERRCCVRYETPEGAFVNYSRYAGFYLYHSYDDAMRDRNRVKPFIHYEVEKIVERGNYDLVSVKGWFETMGFCCFKLVGTWNNLLEVYGFRYKNGRLTTEIIKSTMWVDKDGFHIEPIIPDGVYKTQEEAYASDMPKLVTFADVEDEVDGEQDEKDKRIAELEEIIRKAQEELNKVKGL